MTNSNLFKYYPKSEPPFDGNGRQNIYLPSPNLNRRRYSVLSTVLFFNFLLKLLFFKIFYCFFSSSKNDEISNKIELEIRILDGILKLLNAICNNNGGGSNNLSALNGSGQISQNQPQSFVSGILPTNSSNHSSNAISNILNNALSSAANDQNKFMAAGLAIAAAIMSNVKSADSSSSASSSYALVVNGSNSGAANCSSCSNSNTLNAKSSLMSLQSDLNSHSSFENNQIYQILSACKCLFVSHRKISIYMHLKQLDEEGGGRVADDDEEEDNLSELDECQMNESVARDESSIRLDPTIKLMLSDIRIPLSWKWSDHQRALKSSDTSSLSKYVTFAVIYLGNMVYDTQLITNVDASMTEICFNESFVL